MAITAFSNPVPGIWPLGKITVTTAGTAVPLNINVGAQTESGAVPTKGVRQLNLACPTTGNTGLVYLIRKIAGTTTSKTNTGVIVTVIEPGQVIPLPDGLLVNSTINVDDYVLDADTSGNVIYACAIVS